MVSCARCGVPQGRVEGKVCRICGNPYPEWVWTKKEIKRLEVKKRYATAMNGTKIKLLGEGKKLPQ